MNNLENSRVFVSHLEAEHRRLDQAVTQVKESMSPGDAPAIPLSSTNQVLGLLEELRLQLIHHFHDEEQEGCLDEAACRCPSVSDEAKRVRHEHVELLSELDEIILTMKLESKLHESLTNITSRFQDFAHTLRQHEAAETRVIESVFGSEED